MSGRRDRANLLALVLLLIALVGTWHGSRGVTVQQAFQLLDPPKWECK